MQWRLASVALGYRVRLEAWCKVRGSAYTMSNRRLHVQSSLEWGANKKQVVACREALTFSMVNE